MACDRTPGTGGTIQAPFVNWARTVKAYPQSSTALLCLPVRRDVPYPGSTLRSAAAVQP